MAHRYENLVRDTGSTGTGTWTLSGSPPTGYRAFSVMSDGDTCDYVAYTKDGSSVITALELGVGTVGGTGTTLARTSITFSTNGNNAVNFATAPTIEVIAPASFFTSALVSGGALDTPASGTLTNCGGLPVSGITASTSTALGVGSVELGHASDTTLSRSAAGILAVEGNPLVMAGKHTVSLHHSFFVAASTNGAATYFAEKTTNKNRATGWAFDATTQETIMSPLFAMPKSWNESTVTVRVPWEHLATTTNFGVVWGVSMVAIGNDDTQDAAFGTEVLIADTGGTTDDFYRTDESSAITIGGTPQEGDYVQIRIRRVPADGSDTCAVDCICRGLELYITTNAATDA